MREIGRRIAIVVGAVAISIGVGAAVGYTVGKYLAWWREIDR